MRRRELFRLYRCRVECTLFLLPYGETITPRFGVSLIFIEHTMATISSIGSSGLQAAQLRLDASANNVANMNTPGYRREVVAQEEASESNGVRATVQREQDAKGVALEQEAVEQMSATYAFKANLQTIKTQDEMMGSLLDVKA